jgi:hypothetical protein
MSMALILESRSVNGIIGYPYSTNLEIRDGGCIRSRTLDEVTLYRTVTVVSTIVVDLRSRELQDRYNFFSKGQS